MSFSINSLPYINPYLLEQLKNQNQAKDSQTVESQFADIFLREFLKPMFQNNWGASLTGSEETENLYRDLLMMNLIELLKQEDAFGLRDYLNKKINEQNILNSPSISTDEKTQMSTDEE